MAHQKPHASGLNGAVAAVLRGEKAMAGLGIPALSERSGIPYESLRRYLACERAIDVGVLDAVATALGTTAGDVMVRAQARLADQAEKEAPADSAAYEAVRGNSALGAALDKKKSGTTPPPAEGQRDVPKDVNNDRRGA